MSYVAMINTCTFAPDAPSSGLEDHLKSFERSLYVFIKTDFVLICVRTGSWSRPSLFILSSSTLTAAAIAGRSTHHAPFSNARCRCAPLKIFPPPRAPIQQCLYTKTCYNSNIVYIYPQNKKLLFVIFPTRFAAATKARRCRLPRDPSWPHPVRLHP